MTGVRGYLKAWDPIKQQEAWHIELPGVWNGGMLSTGGSLVFEGNSAGQFAAYNASTGAALWSTPVQAGVIASPISYVVDGQQHVAIVVGWGGTIPLSSGEYSRKGAPPYNKSRVLAFRLGGRAQLPPPPAAPSLPTPPARFGDQQTLGLGKLLFGASCSVCHGDGAVGGGVLPDLRHSTMLSDSARWNRIVMEGSLANSGMVSFAAVMPPGGAEAIRAWVTSRANDEISPLPAAALPAATAAEAKPKAAAAKPAAAPKPSAAAAPKPAPVAPAK
jgi:alcohol dehydrogenase (cytochrome c)/quinohemoprotein ethanol dehydrogenase